LAKVIRSQFSNSTVLCTQGIIKSMRADLQSTNVRKLAMLTTEVGCECDAEYSHSLTPAASQFNAKPLSSFSSQQKLTQHNETTQVKSESF